MLLCGVVSHRNEGFEDTYRFEKFRYIGTLEKGEIGSQAHRWDSLK